MIMKKLIFLSIFFLLIPFYASSQEKEIELEVTQFNVVTSVLCGVTKKFHKVFSEKILKFTGFIDEAHVVKLFVNKDHAYSIIVENSGGLSCIQFGGMPGMLSNNENKDIKPTKFGVK